MTDPYEPRLVNEIPEPTDLDRDETPEAALDKEAGE